MKTTIILHHSAISGDARQLDDINEYHKSKWGRGIEYHRLIEKNGVVHKNHPDEFIGYHAGPVWNPQSIGVCLAGNFSFEMPTQEQIASLTSLLMRLQAEHNIPDDMIFLHNEVRSTACPVTDLRALYFAYRKSLTLPKRYSAEAQVKRLRRAISRAVGYTKDMLERQYERLMKRV